MKKQKKQKEGSYDVYSFRLHEQTYEKLKDMKKDSGMSWNRFIYNLTKRI